MYRIRHTAVWLHLGAGRRYGDGDTLCNGLAVLELSYRIPLYDDENGLPKANTMVIARDGRGLAGAVLYGSVAQTGSSELQIWGGWHDRCSLSQTDLANGIDQGCKIPLHTNEQESWPRPGSLSGAEML